MDWSCNVSSPERPATVITGIPALFFPPDMAYNALSSNAAWGRWATRLALDKVGGRSCDLSPYIFGLGERKCSRLLSLVFNPVYGL